MRKLVLGMFVSLDGFVSGPNGEVDWIFKTGDDATDEWIIDNEVARLKAQPGKDIRALGGASFAQNLAAHGLIDEYHLMVCPVALGKGVPLFSGLSKPVDLQLVSSKTFAGGAIALVYRTA